MEMKEIVVKLKTVRNLTHANCFVLFPHADIHKEITEIVVRLAGLK